ncbi:hypothetical protein [Desertibacillus haloalkaliphilus]|nr:hypothetical protein [Desertibacillus haloalkaliphilus]MBU8906426.1 hypothetical protein [Desertibacillus haloalkaliphilus]
MNVGDKALYKGEECKILYIYSSGYCEIRIDRLRVELVRKDELKRKE